MSDRLKLALLTGLLSAVSSYVLASAREPEA
jgi:hypothetical protein